MSGVGLWYSAFLDLILGTFKQPFSGKKYWEQRRKLRVTQYEKFQWRVVCQKQFLMSKAYKCQVITLPWKVMPSVKLYQLFPFLSTSLSIPIYTIPFIQLTSGQEDKERSVRAWVFFHHALHSTPTTIPHRAQQGNAILPTQINEEDYCQRRYECQELLKLFRCVDSISDQ